MPLSEKELMEHDAKRNIGEELLASIIDVKAGRHGQVHHVEVTEAPKRAAKPGSPNHDSQNCWECPYTRYRSRSKVDARHQAPPVLCCTLQRYDQTFSATFYHANPGYLPAMTVLISGLFWVPLYQGSERLTLLKKTLLTSASASPVSRRLSQALASCLRPKVWNS